MNSGDKILDRIKSDCDKSVAAVMQKAEKQRLEIIEAAKAEAAKNTLELEKKTEQKLEMIKTSSKSRAQLETRNTVLKRKRAEIDKTVNMLLEKLLSLPDKEYFEIILKLASKLKGKTGVLFFNERDLKRLPKDFSQSLAKCSLNAEISESPAKISGGFILKSGDIEENMDFSSLINAKRDELEDIINSKLFA